MRETKAFGVAELKATGSKDSGQFEALVSVFGNVDLVGDRVLKGAFVKTLSAPPEGNGLPPIVWSHHWEAPPIGASITAEEAEGYKTAGGDTVDGLYVKGELFVDENQLAKEVYTAMSRKGGDDLPPLRQFSFGYEATKALTKKDSDFEALDAKHVRDLVEINLFEVGPTLKGANPQTTLIGTKAMAGELAQLLGLQPKALELLAKAGARNSSSDSERLQQIHDLAVENGAGCSAKGARAAQIVFKALAGKGYDDVDTYAVYMLGQMIDYGTSFMASEADPADVERMRAHVADIAQMLFEEISETAAEEAQEVLDAVTASYTGIEGKTALPRVTSNELDELLLAVPIH